MSDNANTHAAYNVKFNYASSGVTFEQWISLFTVCLAPLIAHVLSGAPGPVYLSDELPKWHDRLVQYNPVSIVWRYMAITERCVCMKLSPDEVVTSNAVFWTGTSWSGSVTTMEEVKVLCVQRSRSLTERVFSTDTLKTIIVTIQGIGACITIIPSRWRSGSVDSMANIFLPLAVMGLLRLPAAYWLTTDRLFADRADLRSQSLAGIKWGTSKFGPDSLPSAVAVTKEAETTKTELNRSTPSDSSRHDPRAYLIRAIYMLFMLFMLGLCLWLMLYLIIHGEVMSLTICLLYWFYIPVVISVIAIFTFHLPQQRTGKITTMIPCGGRWWYKVHTCVVIILTMLLIIIAALETHSRTPGGTDWTTG